MERAAAEDWIRSQVRPAGTIETQHERPWATVLRVPLSGGRVCWFKACAPVQAFEPRLTAELFARWPDRVAEVLAYDEERGWLLLADAGTPIGAFGNPPEAWLEGLPLYAELQRGEAEHAREHLTHGVPDLRVATLPARYEELLGRALPLDADEVCRLRGFATRFAELCGELAACDVPETVQHDDLHMANVYAHGDRLRLLDWGDASISHPFASGVVTFRFLEEVTRLAPTDPWFARLRDAYLEPWGRGHADVFALAIRVGMFAQRAPGRVSVTTYLGTRDGSSTRGLESCSDAPSPRRSTRGGRSDIDAGVVVLTPGRLRPAKRGIGDTGE